MHPNPFGSPSRDETSISPAVEVNRETDELIIRIPGAQLMQLQSSPSGAGSPADKQVPTDEAMIVLIEEVTDEGNTYTWLCNTSRMDENCTEHEALMLAIVSAMQDENNTHYGVGTDMLARIGGTSRAAMPLHASLPCQVHAKIRITAS